MEGCRSVIKLINIEKSYNAGKLNEFHVLKGISAEIKDGELVAIVGKSGAGKSTLLHIIACIDNYDSGEYYIDDLLIKNMSEKKLANIRNEKIGIVMQDFSLVEDFTVLENVIIPLDFAKKKSKNTKEQALKALKQVKMEEYAKKRVKNLSGGEKQRVAIARAIINNPDLILADEPTGSVQLVQHYPKTTPVIFWSLSILISLMTERQSVRFSSRVKVS